MKIKKEIKEKVRKVEKAYEEIISSDTIEGLEKTLKNFEKKFKELLDAAREFCLLYPKNPTASLNYVTEKAAKAAIDTERGGGIFCRAIDGGSILLLPAENVLIEVHIELKLDDREYTFITLTTGDELVIIREKVWVDCEGLLQDVYETCVSLYLKEEVDIDIEMIQRLAEIQKKMLDAYES